MIDDTRTPDPLLTMVEMLRGGCNGPWPCLAERHETLTRRYATNLAARPSPDTGLTIDFAAQMRQSFQDGYEQGLAARLENQ